MGIESRAWPCRGARQENPGLGCSGLWARAGRCGGSGAVRAPCPEAAGEITFQQGTQISALFIWSFKCEEFRLITNLRWFCCCLKVTVVSDAHLQDENHQVLSKEQFPSLWRLVTMAVCAMGWEGSDGSGELGGWFFAGCYMQVVSLVQLVPLKSLSCYWQGEGLENPGMERRGDTMAVTGSAERRERPLLLSIFVVQRMYCADPGAALQKSRFIILRKLLHFYRRFGWIYNCLHRSLSSFSILLMPAFPLHRNPALEWL